MNENFLSFLKGLSKKLLALLIVASMVFNANFFDAIKIIYADVLVDNKEIKDDLQKNEDGESVDINIEEKGNIEDKDLLKENFSQKKVIML